MESETNASLGGKRPQMSRQLELRLDERGEAPQTWQSEEEQPATSENGRFGTGPRMEAVVHPRNIRAALERVRKNKGSPGEDGMTVEELPTYLHAHWETIRMQLLAGHYQPRAVLRRQIPKSGGGLRDLGIPCAIDRVIQQAILQVLQPHIDPTFSRHSYGFRPGRSAHGAICAAQRYIQGGRTYVADVDLEKFFDRVNHDVLMGRMAKRIADPRLLGLIRRYLEAGVMAHGVVTERHEGTPQGGPLSPLLANVLLDEVDQELEQRGHAFVRYADDCNVYLHSRRAALRVMQLLERLYGSLRLRINETKSAVAPVWGRKFLGYCFRKARNGAVQRAVAPKALALLKEKVREKTSRACGRSIQATVTLLAEFLRGWKAYFRLAEQRSVLEETDGWIRRRLRAIMLKQWKNGPTIYRQLKRRGLSDEEARQATGNRRSWWKQSRKLVNKAIRNREFDQLGLPRLAA